jgi:TonB family protein
LQLGYFKVIHFSAMLSILAHGVLLFELGGLPSAGKLLTAKPSRMVYIQASLSPAVEPAQSTTKQPAESPVEPDQLVPTKEKGTSKLVKKSEKKKNTKRTKNVEPSSSVKQPSAPLQQTSFASIVESRQSYILQALEKIEKQKSYPMQARRRRISGSVTLSIRVASNGLIEQLECRQGPVSLCRAAVSAAEKAQPLPALPEGTNHLAFEYQMLYKLH